jgi:cysteinyl-tRNA synthetase
MRSLVKDLSQWSKNKHSSFLVIPQNGIQLTTTTGTIQGGPDLAYLGAVDAVAQEDLYYGYDGFDLESPFHVRSELGAFLEQAHLNEEAVLVTNYCSTPRKVDDAYQRCDEKGFVSFAASSRELDEIPTYPATPVHVNDAVITAIDSVRNFLYLLDPEALGTRNEFISAIQGTDYDLLITDAYYGDTPFTPAEVEALRTKANGGKRLVIAYMSIGEAEDYRYYWQEAWKDDPPSWMAKENPEWEGNYKVKYWEKAWQDIIFGNDDSYLQKILDAGFDGVYLDIIDAFEYFEENGE